MKIAAIDIGSNGVRLKIYDVVVNKKHETVFNKLVFLRLPVRLGFDVFEHGKIKEKNKGKIVDAMRVFKDLIDFYHVKIYRACATSAMRDAKNGKQIAAQIKRETGIKIEIISGDVEAALIHENHIAENLDRDRSYLYVNVGGGSSDIIFFANGRVRFKKSIDIGTIRILKNLVDENDWNLMKKQIKTYVKSKLPIVAIGSGGNINRIFDITEKKSNKPLTLKSLKMYYKELSRMTINERMEIYNLRADRADVIVPALQIYINLMSWAGIAEMYVPKIGLVEGIAHALYWEVVNEI